MRAFALDAYDSAGTVHDIEMPEPGPGEVRIKVAGAGLNPADVYLMKGFYQSFAQIQFPLVPGSDHCGVVDKVGPEVTRWKAGDAVFGNLGKMAANPGSLAQYTTPMATAIASRPAGLDVEFAAGLGLTGVCAWQCVDEVAAGSGQVIMIVGAAGGIGGFATQMARRRGAKVIAVTRGSNAAYVRGLGADEVVDYTAGDVVDAVRRAHPKGIDGLIDTVGDKGAFAASVELVREGGRAASMRGSADVEGLAARGIRATNVRGNINEEALDRLAGLAAAGELDRPEIKTFRLEAAGEAYRELASGHVRGKLVVVP